MQHAGLSQQLFTPRLTFCSHAVGTGRPAEAPLQTGRPRPVGAHRHSDLPAGPNKHSLRSLMIYHWRKKTRRGTIQLEAQAQRLLGAIVEPTDIETADGDYRVNQDDHFPRHLRAGIRNYHSKARSAVCQQVAVSVRFSRLSLAMPPHTST